MSIRTPHKLHGYTPKASYRRKNAGCSKPLGGHQNVRERARRKRQIAAGQLRVTDKRWMTENQLLAGLQDLGLIAS